MSIFIDINSVFAFLSPILRMVSLKKTPSALIVLAYVFSILFSALPVPTVTPAVSAAAHCVPNDATLQGYWPFEEGSGTTTADESLNSNDGTLNGVPAWDADTPTLSFANDFSLSFDGTDDNVSMGNVTELNFERTDEFSGSAWIKRDGTGVIDVILSKRQASNYRGYVFYVRADNTLEFTLQNAGSNRLRVAGSSSLSNGTWYHVAFSYDGSSLASGVELYVDGTQETTTSVEETLTDTIQSTGSFEIGDQTVLPFPFDGKIDDVRIYDRALNAAEVSDLHSGSCEAPASETTTGGGANGFFYRQRQLIKKLNNLGNANFVNSPTAPAGFGGPEYFGGGNQQLDWDQLSAVCIVHDEYFQELYTFDVIEKMAENFAHMFGVSEAFIFDIIQHGTHCDAVYSAQAEDERIEQELIAKEEQRKHDELMALYHMYQPETVEFAVGEDGYPVSTDMVWNACIRNVEVFLPGEDKPVNCRRFHKGHTWTHPDTHVSFKWSDRVVKRIKVRGALVVTHVVPTPDLYDTEVVAVNHKTAERLVLPTEQYMAVKTDENIKAMIVYGAEQSVLSTAVLSDSSVTISQ